MYEGAPDWPERDRFWRIVETLRRHHPLHRADRHPRLHEVGHRASRPARPVHPAAARHASGEPINPEAWIWYHEHIGKGRCPIVDTWWQTETGGIMITPLPAVVVTKPGSATIPYPGITPELVDDKGNRLAVGRRLPHHRAAVAGHAARRSTATTSAIGDLLEPFPRTLLHRRRREAGRGRLLVDPRAGGRRAQRRGAPDRHHGSGERPGGPSRGRRGGGGGAGPRAQGPGARGVRDPQGRARSRRPSSRTSSRRT